MSSLERSRCGDHHAQNPSLRGLSRDNHADSDGGPWGDGSPSSGAFDLDHVLPRNLDGTHAPLVVRREAELAPVPHLGRPRLELWRDAHLVHVVPLLAGDVEAAARWVVGDAVEHEAVRSPPRTDLLGEKVSSGEGATGRGLRSPAWSDYSSPTPGLAHAS